jgi:hypothetical protein
MKYEIGQEVILEPRKGQPIRCRVMERDEKTGKYRLNWSKIASVNTVWIPEGSIRTEGV